ncbi:MAG: asparaginase [Roseburia sp.]|nr:asparaginase [Roseburia sp.]
MKLLVIFTGGTIGSTLNDGYISTDCGKAYQLIERYRNLNRRSADFDLLEPFSLLSENMTGETITALGNCVRENIHKPYDGIIITHGSDTIQYTAAALSYFLPRPPIPVLLVCSQLVLEHPLANGLANFSAAVDFIASGAGTGVFVPYRNHDGVIYIHRGTRLLPHLPYGDDLHSIYGQSYGIMQENGCFTKNKPLRQSESDKTLSGAHGLQLPLEWHSGVLRLFPYPGMQYPSLDYSTLPESGAKALCPGSGSRRKVSVPVSEGQPKAVLLDTYHSGTLCSMTPGMEAFFHAAAQKGLPVFLTGADAGPDYDSVKLWKKLHVTTLPPASPIAMYMKLWMALCSPKLLQSFPLDEIMKTPLSQDILCV